MSLCLARFRIYTPIAGRAGQICCSSFWTFSTPTQHFPFAFCMWCADYLVVEKHEIQVTLSALIPFLFCNRFQSGFDEWNHSPTHRGILTPLRRNGIEAHIN